MAHAATDAAHNDLSGFSHQQVEVNGTRLHAVVGGQGEPLLLLHGWPQTWRAWREVMAPLAGQGYQVIVPDLRGLGRSAPAADGYGKDDQAQDMRELVQRLSGGTDKLRLVGHDIGGMIAFAYARRHPDEVECLALVELALPGLGLERAMNPADGGSFHFGLFMTPEVPEWLLAGRERAFFQWWFARLSAQPHAFPPAEIDAAAAAYSGKDALRRGFEHYRTLIADGRTNQAWIQAGGILNMPVLAIGGEHNAGDRLAHALRPVAADLRSAVIRDSGHFVPEEQPQALLAELLPFLAGQCDTR
jgi:pimeloyl-ACP methyl ester carboxylesterase